MNLWIRSQDKEELIKTDRVFLNGDNDEVRANYYGGIAILGEYKKEGRALEVLDEIQKLLTEERLDKLVNGLGTPIGFNERNLLVYEMPSE